MYLLCVRFVMYESRRGHNDINQLIMQLTTIRPHFKNLSHSSTTHRNETLQCKNLCSIRDWFCIIFSEQPNEAIAASFNGCQKSCFTLVTPILTSKRRKNYTLQCTNVTIIPLTLKKGIKSNLLGRNTRKFVVRDYA